MKQYYLIYGEEEYLKKERLDALIGESGADASELFRFSGSTTDLQEAESLASTMPLFSSTRCIVLKDSGLFSEAGAGAFEEIPESTVLIFVEKKPNDKSALYKLIKEKGRLFYYPKAEDVRGPAQREHKADVRDWVQSMIRKEGLSAGGREISEIIELAGYDRTNLASELEKLICYVKAQGKSAIGREDVENICTRTLQARTYELIGYQLSGESAKALRCFEELLGMKVTPLMVLRALEYELERMYYIREMMDRRLPDREILEKLQPVSKWKVADWQLEKMKRQLRPLSLRQLKEGIGRCLEAETRFKNGDLTDRLAVELLLAGSF